MLVDSQHARGSDDQDVAARFRGGFAAEHALRLHVRVFERRPAPFPAGTAFLAKPFTSEELLAPHP